MGSFVGDIISRVGLGFPGRVHQALGLNRKRKVFCSGF